MGERLKTSFRNLARVAATALRKAAPPTVAWISAHKAIVAIILLALYIVFVPRKVTTVEVVRDVSTPVVSSDIQTAPVKPPQTQPSSVIGVPLYDPNSADKDPAWGLPSAIDSEQNKTFALRLKRLETRFASYSDRLQLLTREYEAMAGGPIEGLLFERIAGNGFKDRDLPIEWRKVARYKGLDGLGAVIEDELFRMGTESVFSGRVSLAKSDVVRGEPTMGDTLFAAAFEKYLDNADKDVDQQITTVASFSARAANEFPELAITYYDPDKTGHVHAANVVPVQSLSQGQIAEVQKLYTKCNSDAQEFDRSLDGVSARKVCIKNLRDNLMNVSDPKLKADWSAIVQARELVVTRNWGEQYWFNHLPDSLISGQVTSQDKAAIQSYADKLANDTKEATRQTTLQLAFKAEIAKFPSIDKAIGGDDIWNTGEPAKKKL